MTAAPAAYSPTAKLGFAGSIQAGRQLIPVCWRVLAIQPAMLVVPVIVAAIRALACYLYVEAFGNIDGLLGPKYAAAIKCFPLLAALWATSVVGDRVVSEWGRRGRSPGAVAATDLLRGGARRRTNRHVDVPGQALVAGATAGGSPGVTSAVRGAARGSAASSPAAEPPGSDAGATARRTPRPRLRAAARR